MKIKLTILLVICLLYPISTFALKYPKMNSKIIEVYDLSDNAILYEIKAKDVVSVASLTKIATSIVAIENIKNLDEKVIITSSILNTVNEEAHVAGLKSGNVVTYRDLLYATIVASGADAANALAILSSGSLSNHVNKMNELVKKIGLEHTKFQNVVGLDNKDNYSTADEIRKLLVYALNNSTFEKMYTTKKYTLSNGLVVNTTLKLYDKNGTVDTSFIIGSKTGYTGNAGYCLAYLTDINGHKIVIVSLNAVQSGNNFYNLIDATNIVKFMKNNYKEEVLVEEKKEIKKIPVNLSDIETYIVYSSKEIKKYLPSDYDINNLVIKYDGLEELSYRNKKEDQIGKVYYYFNDELLFEQDVILDQEIHINWMKFLSKYYYVVIIIILLIISSLVLFLKMKKKKRLISI